MPKARIPVRRLRPRRRPPRNERIRIVGQGATRKAAGVRLPFAVLMRSSSMLDRRFGWALAVAAALLFAAGPAEAQTVPTSREQIGLTFAPLVKKVAPAVVNIYARQVIQAREVSPLFNDPFFQQFFGQGGFGF